METCTVKWILPLALGVLATIDCGQPPRAALKPDSAAAAGAGSAPVPAAAADTGARGDSTRGVALALRAMGSAKAPITVYEMSDFQCPYCRRHATETWPALQAEYVKPGKVRWIFINFPLTQIHKNAVAAAEFGLCAATQGRFWPAHDLLYAYQEQWAPLDDPTPLLMTFADSIHIPRKTMLACLQDPATAAAVRHDAEGAARAGANSTPSFYIAGGLMSGAYPIDVFRQVLDSIYAEKTKPKK
jgi:protein-disulfide isomerase